MRLVLFVFMCLSTYAAIAQKPFCRDFSLSETNVSVRVNDLKQDATGYIWLATDIGLIRFNGRNFMKIQDSVHQPATALSIKNGSIWVGYNNGKIGTVVNQYVKPVQIESGPSSPITSLFSNGMNVLLAGTEEQGIFVIINNVAVPFNVSKGLSDDFIYDFSVDGNDRLLAASDKGINDVSIANSKVVVNECNTRHGLPDNIVSVIRKIPRTDDYWIGTQEGGIVVYRSGAKTISAISSVPARWPYGQVNDILAVTNKRAWVATESGYLLEVKINDSLKAEITPFYYPGKVFRKLLLDKAGNIWCGTNRGLTMMTGEYVSDIRLALPYSLYDVTAMIHTDNSLLIALKKELFRVYLNDSAPRLSHLFTAKATISSLFLDADNRLWIGTLGDGLYYETIGAAAIKPQGIEELSPDASILNISGTKDRIWLAGLKGVEELTYPVDGKISLVKHHGKKSGIGSDYVYQLFPDKSGNMWMATDGAGVCMYDGAEYHHWNSSFGQGSKVAYSITEDVFGDMWAATMNKDLFHFHNNKWENLRLPETQYPDINISTVVANEAGQVISVYQRCIDEWYPASQYFRHFNSALGIGIDSTSNALNCVAKDGEGDIYLPYQHGIAKFRNQSEQYDIRPSVHITNPTVYSKPVLNDKHEFDYDENYIGFTFDGISYANHERLNYRYMLQGYNDDWVYTNDASASFPKLSPGKYNFRIQVSLNPAFEHPNEDDYSFNIAAPFWKTNLFYGLMTIVVLLIVYLYIKIREQRLKSISQLQQERMVFEYEHLKSQVNPHFLFNSLYALSILIEEKQDSALKYTVHLADLYRNMLTHSKQDLIPLKEEIEILNNYIHIQQTRFGDALKVIIEIPDEVMERKKIVPLAIQLLVENAIKHNVVSMSQPLIIYITAVNDEIIVRNRMQPKMSREKGAGIGLINIKQRYGLLTKRLVTFGVYENQFIVQLPLL